MLDANTLNYILGLAALGGIAFGIYKSYRKPQEEANKTAALLAQQLNFDKVAMQERFKEVSQNAVQATALAQNHIHTVDVRLESFISTQNVKNEAVSNALTKIFTILDERLPAKK